MTRQNTALRALQTMTAALAAAGTFGWAADALGQSVASPAGLWDATVVITTGPPGAEPAQLVKVDVPFRFEIECAGPKAPCAAPKGAFFNGDEKVTSTSGGFANGKLVLNFDEYGTRLEAVLDKGRLEGQYTRGTRGAPYPFRATRFKAIEVGDARIPPISGLWNIQVKSTKGEAAWQLIVRQSGAEASAVILRIDGDTGTLTGAYHDGSFVLSHFSGARPLRLELSPRPDGTLAVVQNREAPLTAIRADQALARGLPQPSDPSRFTSVKDPTEPLRFSFPDLEGRLVSNADPRFRGRVVIVSISGSWCPNCHDETPFLVDLYKKYKARGLEIVSLSFEEEAQLKNPVRLRAFMKRYGVEYTVLLPGEPKELNDKLPQAVNLNSFPTTFFLGRDGRVRSAHAGFPGKASGTFHTEAKEAITALVEKLLAEPAATNNQ
jgi:thiol-disulfide isomerase/thioredoxin